MRGASITLRDAGRHSLRSGFAALLLALASTLGGCANNGAAGGSASGALASRPAKLLYALLIVAFAYHLAAGIRHLVWDAGYALERRDSRRSAGLVLAAAIVLAVAFGYWAFFGRVGA